MDKLTWAQIGELTAVMLRYNPDQPRAPRGTAAGGQWVAEQGGLFEAEPAAERQYTFESSGQATLFGATSEDLPLFSGAAYGPRQQPTPQQDPKTASDPLTAWAQRYDANAQRQAARYAFVPPPKVEDAEPLPLEKYRN